MLLLAAPFVLLLRVVKNDFGYLKSDEHATLYQRVAHHVNPANWGAIYEQIHEAPLGPLANHGKFHFKNRMSLTVLQIVLVLCSILIANPLALAGSYVAVSVTSFGINVLLPPFSDSRMLAIAWLVGLLDFWGAACGLPPRPATCLAA